MDYIFILYHLILFSLSHTTTVAFNAGAAKNNNNNNKEIVRSYRPMGYIGLRYYSSSVSRKQNNNVLPYSVGKFSTVSAFRCASASYPKDTGLACARPEAGGGFTPPRAGRAGLVEESLHP